MKHTEPKHSIPLFGAARRVICLLAVVLGTAVACTPAADTAETTAVDAADTTVESITDAEETSSVAALYDAAMRDSVMADEDELLPLVCITADSDMVTWDEAGERVLMLSWHRYPDSYPEDTTVKLAYGEVWTFTDKEILKRYDEEFDGVADPVLRLEQLIGLPEEKAYTHVTAFWVEPAEMIRPAYTTDITVQPHAAHLDGSALGEHKSWFDGNILGSYFYGAYPWTRLGYTYDWADGPSEYGLSEFIILPESEVEVAFTVTTDEFLSMLAEGKLAA